LGYAEIPASPALPRIRNAMVQGVEPPEMLRVKMDKREHMGDQNPSHCKYVVCDDCPEWSGTQKRLAFLRKDHRIVGS
jgi:hypothetical protein